MIMRRPHKLAKLRKGGETDSPQVYRVRWTKPLTDSPAHLLIVSESSRLGAQGVIKVVESDLHGAGYDQNGEEARTLAIASKTVPSRPITQMAARKGSS